MVESDQKVVHFPFKYNNKDYECLFEILSRPFKLQIGTVGNNPEIFKFDVLPGFIIETYLSTVEYYKLVRILGIRYDPDHLFKTGDFLRVLNAHLPKNCTEAKEKQRLAVRERKTRLKDVNKDIFIGWYPNPLGNTVRDENYEKTKKYFGTEYADYLRKINTSTRWTRPDKNQERVKSERLKSHNNEK